MKFIIPSGTRLVCDKCNHMGVVGIPVTDTLLPCSLLCRCGDRLLIIDDNFRFPKLDPTLAPTFHWKVFRLRNGKAELMNELQDLPHDEKLSEQSTQVPAASAPEKVLPGSTSFRTRQQELSSALLLTLRCISAIRQDCEQVGQQVEGEVLRTLDESFRIQHGYNPELITKFLKQPWVSMKPPLIDEDLLPNTRLLAMPQFFERQYGIPLPSDGGYFLQLITPYVRPSFPLETSLATDLGIQPTPQLYVAGNKVFGRDLRLFHKQIAGTREDVDHTATDPSIVILEQLVARRWLLTQGVSCWPEQPVRQTEYFPNADGACELRRVPRYQQAWSRFLQHGRLGIFWQSVEQLREFTLNLCSAVKGHKIIITGSASQAAEWRTLYAGRLGVVGDANILWHSWEDFHSLAGLQTVRLIIVDYSIGMPTEFLERLLLYSGRIVVLATDPVMDILEDNIEASLLYTLCGWVDLEEPKTAQVIAKSARTPANQAASGTTPTIDH